MLVLLYYNKKFIDAEYNVTYLSLFILGYKFMFFFVYNFECGWTLMLSRIIAFKNMKTSPRQ